MIRIISLIGMAVVALAWGLPCSSAADAQEEIVKVEDQASPQTRNSRSQQAAGEFFGQPVSMDNYLFAKSAASVFGGSWGREIKTPQDLEDRTWEDLILSFEAYRRGVEVPQEKLDDEIGKVLKEEKVAFDWKKDRPAFEKWVQERVKEPVVLFENQLKHLIQLQMLREQVRKGLNPEVTDQEAMQKYLNEYNTIELDMVRFDDQAAAEDFYQKAKKDPKLWERELKKNPKFSLKTGFVSFEWLIEAWKFPKDDLYKMLELPAGALYKPLPIYKGYAVTRILLLRPAVKEDFAAKRDEYRAKVKAVKQYQGVNDWLVQLKKDARLKIYVGQNGAA